MKELYSRIDKDNSGCLDLKEVLLFMKALTDDLSEENITAIFQNLDLDQSDSIDFDEFMVDTTMKSTVLSIFFRISRNCSSRFPVPVGSPWITPTEMRLRNPKSKICST